MTRHIDTAYALALVRQAHSENKADLAGKGLLETRVICRDQDCGRTFIGLDALQEHAEAVHTFDDIRQLLSEKIQERYGRQGDYRAEPPIPSIYTWVSDLAVDWVVFTVESASECQLYKADYTIDESNVVTIGAPVEVVRRTVYDPVSH